MKNILVTFLYITSIVAVYSQNTIGTLLHTDAANNAYTLFAPITSNQTYLINNCGEIINQWNSNFLPGASVYLLENGNLLRTGRITNSEINFGGLGGKIELFDWDGNLLWEYTHSSSTFTQHHDIYPLSNGNILLLSAEIMPLEEAIQAGRSAILLEDGRVFNEQVLEIEPIGTNQANIVWEWNVKDHLIQDLDATKDNFGIIENNPQLLNFNYTNTTGSDENWLHMNSLQYNEDLDQIMLSSRILSEIYVIDHSTTSLEAATALGGDYGKGGDILYRWGNKEAYAKGNTADRTLYGQHYPHWIANGLNDEGKILIYNNGNSTRPYSSVDIIQPLTTTPGNYTYNSTTGYGPLIAESSYTAEINTDFYSVILSSAQRLPNGNTLICEGDSGHFFEINTANEIVWDYVSPDTTLGIATQGDVPFSNLVFRALKFPLDYPAFDNRTLTPMDPIELNPNLDNCNLLSTPEFLLQNIAINIYPNPVIDILNINYKEQIKRLQIFTISGQILVTANNTKTINLQNLTSGLYIIKIETEKGIITKKLIKN